MGVCFPCPYLREREQWLMLLWPCGVMCAFSTPHIPVLDLPIRTDGLSPVVAW